VLEDTLYSVVFVAEQLFSTNVKFVTCPGSVAVQSLERASNAFSGRKTRDCRKRMRTPCRASTRSTRNQQIRHHFNSVQLETSEPRALDTVSIISTKRSRWLDAITSAYNGKGFPIRTHLPKFRLYPRSSTPEFAGFFCDSFLCRSLFSSLKQGSRICRLRLQCQQSEDIPMAPITPSFHCFPQL
jgi:hypothetical protein